MREAYCVSAGKMPRSNSRLVMRLSRLAANFNPQPLNVKSSTMRRPSRHTVMPPWSRAQVSSEGSSTKRMREVSAPASCPRTSSSDAHTTSTSSCRAISVAMRAKQAHTSGNMCAQSVPACGHVSCTKRCGAHSGGSRGEDFSICLYIIPRTSLPPLSPLVARAPACRRHSRRRVSCPGFRCPSSGAGQSWR